MSIDRIGKELAFGLLRESGEKPQFKPDQLSTLQEILDDRGVLYTVEQVPANELTVINSDALSKEVVEEKKDLIKDKGKVKPVVVSEEYDIIDGRHSTRAIGEMQGEGQKVPVLRIHRPTSEAVGMLSDMQTQINEQQEEMNLVVVFSGRFQPFHRGHYKVYDHLVNRFGRNDVFIGTSNKVDPPRSPFTFKQKKKIITRLFDVPHENVVQVKNPYAPKEILGQYSEENTAYVAAVSEKDKGRLLGSGYFDEYPPEDGELESYEEGGYVYNTPMAGFTFKGDEISGTRVREAFRSEDIPEEEKKDFFRYIYGDFDQDIYDLMTKRLTEAKLPDKLIEAFVKDGGIDRIKKRLNRRKVIKEETDLARFGGSMVDDGPTTWYENLEDYQDVTREQAEVFGYQVLSYLTDRVDQDFKEDGLPHDSFYPVGIGPQTEIEDPRASWRAFSTAVSEVAGLEVIDFLDALDNSNVLSFGHDDDKNIAMALGDAQIGTVETGGAEGERQDVQSREEELEGQDAGPDPNQPLNESVKKKLNEGGSFGHMNHPFEDLDLTFGDLKNMINLAFDGNLDIEEQPVEKVDGQNLMVSWKDGDLVAARNKGHLRNFGEDAMDLRGVVKKFEGYGAVQDAFEQAFRDLSIALSEVRDSRLQEVFQEGKRWMSLEVIYPAAQNVVQYGDSFIVFHGIIEYDEDGNALDFNKDPAYKLADMVKEVDQKVQEEFEILSPPEVDLPNLQLEDLRDELIGEVEDYMAEYDMSNDNRVMDWHEEWWEEFIREKADEFDYDIPEHVVAGLIKRWAWGNKSGEDGYGLRTFKSEVDHEDFKSWADSFDKNDYKEQFKENIKPLEEVFLRLGGEVLKRVETVLTTDPSATKEDIQSQIQDVRAEIEGAADQEKIEKLQKELARLQKAGGMDKVAALEGIVFQYDGNTYKLTGTFASINQLVGIMKYGR